MHFAFCIHCHAQIISTIAGNGYNYGTGNGGYSGDGGPATSAEFSGTFAVDIDDSGNIFIADLGNNRIRKVEASSGIISTIAGNGFSWDAGDGGPATSAELSFPWGIAFDTRGNIYIADEYYNFIRKITVSTGIISTVAGNGFYVSMSGGGYSGDGGPATAAEMCHPYGVALDDSGNIFIADHNNNVIRKVTASTGIITTVAGTGFASYNGDGGPATSAYLHGPSGVAVDSSGNFYIADFFNNEVRKVTVSTGIISSVAGNYAIGGGYSGDGGPATSAEIETQNISMDKYGNMYIPDGNSLVRMVTASTGIISTVAGINNVFGYTGDGGPATSAEMDGPADAVADILGNIYIADAVNNVVREVTNNSVTTGIKQWSVVGGELAVYPNPNDGTFTLSLSNITEKCEVEIYNVLGEKITPTLLPQSRGGASFSYSINLSSQPNGVYFYRVLREDGILVTEGKFVVQK